MRPRHEQQMVQTDSLQADVMRFMAIIAFCLIAIMALVNEMDVAAVEAKEQAIGTEVLQRETMAVTSDPIAVHAPDAESLPLAGTLSHPPESQRRLELTQMTASGTVRRPDPVIPDLPSEPVAQSAAASTADVPAPPLDDVSLALRFASDTDFLALIASGGIQVFALTPDGTVGLTPGFGIKPAKASGRLYELLPSSVPASLRSKIHPEHRFLVALPDSTVRDIQRLLARSQARGEGGALIVDRNGRVRHET